jgi:hypothetical protein
LARVRKRTKSSALNHHFNAYFDALSELAGALKPDSYALDFPFTASEVKENPYRRLRIGFSFRDLMHLVSLTCPQSEYGRSLRGTISFLLDHSIDNGLVVPAYCKLNGKMERVYRKGEPESRDRPMRLAGFAWYNHNKPMSNTRFTKILAIMQLSTEVDELFDPFSENFGVVSTFRKTALDIERTEVSKFMLQTGKLIRSVSGDG